MSFNELPFAVRAQSLGNQAESQFEDWANHRHVLMQRFGLDTAAGFQANYRIPLWVRARPDYLCEFEGRHAFWEVKGTGRDKILKINVESMKAMGFWSTVLPLHLFIYDSFEHRYATVPYFQVFVYSLDVEKGTYHDGNVHFRFPHELFRWHQSPPR